MTRTRTLVTATEWGVSCSHRSGDPDVPYSRCHLSVHRSLEIPNQWGGIGVSVRHPSFDGLEFLSCEARDAFCVAVGLLKPFIRGNVGVDPGDLPGPQWTVEAVAESIRYSFLAAAMLGRVPSTVQSFAECDDIIDANEWLITAHEALKEPHLPWSQEQTDITNAACDEFNRWLQSRTTVSA